MSMILNPYRFASPLGMTWTLDGMAANGNEVLQLIVNDSVIDAQSPDGSGEVVLTGNVPSGATVKIRCTALDNEDSILTLYNVALSDITCDTLVGPDVLSGGVAYPTFEWVYYNVTAGSSTLINLTIFDAQALSNLVNNLDASTLTGFSDTELVDTWTNKTGGTNATAAGAARGAYVADWNNSLPAIAFSGAQYYGQSLSGYTGGGWTALFVCEITSYSASHRCLFLGTANNPYLTVFSTSGRVYGYNGVIASSNNQQPLSQPVVISMRVTPSGKAIYRNLTQLKADASGNTNLNSTGISNATFPWVGRIAQVLMVSDDLSDSDLIATTKMLEAKWGVAKRSVICDGDSVTRGNKATAGHEYPTVMADSLGSNFDVRNFGVDSQTLNDMSGDAVSQIDTSFGTVLDGRKNIVVAWGGTNDLYFGDSAATVISDYSAYCAARQAAGLMVVACTIIDRTEFGGSWTAADAATVNASIRANWETYADALCDLADDSRLSDYTDTTYYNADGTHLNDAGYAVVAELVEAAVLSIVPSGGI